MKFFGKFKKRIKFFPQENNLLSNDCIVKASSIKRDWFEYHKNVYKEKFVDLNHKNTVESIHLCPGIKSFLNNGIIFKSYNDFFIHSKGDLENPEIDFYKINKDNGSINRANEFSVFYPEIHEGIERPYPEKTPNAFIKLSYPCFVDAPDDIVFLIVPVPYYNGTNFTISSGFLDPKLSNHIHLIFFWHDHDFNNLDSNLYISENVDALIPNNFPLAQFIPIPRNICSEFEIVTDEKDINLQREKFTFLSIDKYRQTKNKGLVNYSLLKDRCSLWEKRNNKKCPFGF